jgi:hypothetical protein
MNFWSANIDRIAKSAIEVLQNLEASENGQFSPLSPSDGERVGVMGPFLRACGKGRHATPTQ